MNPLVSVIITTKNEERNIANCLKSILEQSYKSIEIIVVDNNSTDKTKEIALSFCHSRAPLCHSRVGGNPESPIVKVFNHGPERSAQRNYGVEKSSGEYFLYLDADMTLSESVIKDCVEKISVIPAEAGIQSNNLIALYIPEIIMGESFWCKVRKFERSFYDGTVIDCVRFIKKDKFLEVGGFDETMSGPEDWDLDKKIRRVGKVGLISSPVYHNETEFNLKSYLNKKSYYIKSFDKYIKKWSRSDGSQSDGIKEQVDPDVKKQLGFYYRFIGVFIEKGKWKKLIRHPVLAAGVYFLRIMIGARFLIRDK